MLNESEHHKHLGVTLQSNCRWDEHIKNLTRKVNMLLTCMRNYKYVFSRKALHTMYTSFILPILDYGDILWDCCTQNQATSLENLHLEAIRIIIGGVRGTSHQKLYQESGFTTLKERRKKHRLILFFKIVNGLCPNYLSTSLPQLTSIVNPYHRRRPHERRIPASRKEIHKNSFFPITTSEWNSLPEEIQTTDSISQFKRYVSSDTSVPIYFLHGERREQIIHCRLRLGMSDLNNDLYSRHLTNDPSCACGYRYETAEHYLLKCTIHNDVRLTTILSLNLHPTDELTINNLLFGNEQFTQQSNALIFSQVQKFIKQSKRFTRYFINIDNT